MKFGLTQTQFDQLSKILAPLLTRPDTSIWVFGSRARGDQKPASDIDLLVESKSAHESTNTIITSVRATLEESAFPFKVDLVSRNALADTYLAQILKERVRFD